MVESTATTGPVPTDAIARSSRYSSHKPGFVHVGFYFRKLVDGVLDPGLWVSHLTRYDDTVFGGVRKDSVCISHSVSDYPADVAVHRARPFTVITNEERRAFRDYERSGKAVFGILPIKNRKSCNTHVSDGCDAMAAYREKMERENRKGLFVRPAANYEGVAWVWRRAIGLKTSPPDPKFDEIIAPTRVTMRSDREQGRAGRSEAGQPQSHAAAQGRSTEGQGELRDSVGVAEGRHELASGGDSRL